MGKIKVVRVNDIKQIMSIMQDGNCPFCHSCYHAGFQAAKKACLAKAVEIDETILRDESNETSN